MAVLRSLPLKIRVIVLSDTVQEFNGIRYYKGNTPKDKYFGRHGKRLHRVVWEYHYGQIPEDCEIHHKNNDRSKNNIEDLECLLESAHARLHGLEHVDHLRSMQPKAIVEAAKWHKSAEGRAWHRQQYEKHQRARATEKISFICENCQKPCTASKKLAENGRRKYWLCPTCKSIRRVETGIYNETRKCIVCSSAFITIRSRKTKTCSGKCSSILRGMAKKSKLGVL